MAAFIEEAIFCRRTSHHYQEEGKDEQKSFIQEISKNLKGSPKFLKRNVSQQRSKTYLHLYFEHREYLIELSSSKQDQNLAITMRQIQQMAFGKVASVHLEVLLLKEFNKNKNEQKYQSLCYVQKGCITMAIKFYHQGLSQNRKYWLQFYTQIIIKNFHHFHNTLEKSLLTYRSHCSQLDMASEFQQNLQLVQNINTISANFDISEGRSQYKAAQEAIRVQRQRIKQIQSAIVIEDQLQKVNHSMFQIVKNNCKSHWTSFTLISAFQNFQKKGKKLITIQKPNERKIEDFLFNVIKLEVKQRSPKPFASGGSSHIYILRGLLTFINSVDYTSHKKNQEKSERYIVLKTLKPQFEQRMKSKIIHEKKVVSKLKGSCSNFIPKYYGIQKDLELSNGLLMQPLHGQQLDKYVSNRSQTISLWTKVFILLGIVHGIRHLVNYGIIHLDLKPLNIIVCRHLITKILDYGQAYHEDLCMKEYCPGYTFPYAAPEIFARYDDHINNRPQVPLELTEKQDVFAFGMIMYELLFNGPAMQIPSDKLKKVYYEREVYKSVMFNYEKAASYGRDPIISTLLAIIMRCLHPEPSFRPQFDWIGVSLKLILNSHIEHQSK